MEQNVGVLGCWISYPLGTLYNSFLSFDILYFSLEQPTIFLYCHICIQAVVTPDPNPCNGPSLLRMLAYDPLSSDSSDRAVPRLASISSLHRLEVL